MDDDPPIKCGQLEKQANAEQAAEARGAQSHPLSGTLDEAGMGIGSAKIDVDENVPTVKSEAFDPTYEMGDLLMTGAVDSIMDMPLFHEVDSLMNIKHEDHLNDTIFYLPMTYPMDSAMQVEVDNIQVAEAARTLANELSAPGALLYVAPDSNSKTALVTQHMVKQEPSEHGSSELRAHLKSPTVGGVMGVGGERDLSNSQHGGPHLTNGTVHSGSECSSLINTGKRGVMNGYNSPEHGLSGKSGSAQRRTSKKLSQQQDIEGKVGKHVNGSGDFAKLNGESYSCRSDSTSSSGSDSGSPSHVSAGVIQQTSQDDPPEIHRFVICSDHTMECVLCAFTTESYSAFKSHIICSHPCWRITKKLSKNRLLVERSVKASASSSSSGNSDVSQLRSTTLRATEDPDIQKIMRKYDKNPRKRQLFERNKRLFKCTICLRLFVFEGSVVNHVTDQHGVQRPYDHIHISNDHGQKFGPIYRCSHKNCYFSCESEDELERHNLERHTQVMYRCQLCGYTADSAEAVRGHGVRMHQQQLMCFDSTL